MIYNEELANRIRAALVDHREVEEKKMFGFLVFMVNGKMCLGVRGDEMLCRIGPDSMEALLRRGGCAPLRMKHRTSLRMIMVEESGMKTKNDFNFWINLALESNLGIGSNMNRNAKQRRSRD